VPSATPDIAAATPTPPPLPSATPDIAATLIAGYQPRVYNTYASPDGRWQAQIRIFDCVQLPGQGDSANAYEQLIVTAVESGVETTADGQLQYCGGLGAGGLEGLFWSTDSRFFYYTPARGGVPDGCGFWERPYNRVDVTTWEVEWLGGGPLSPDGMKLATWQGQELVVWDVMGGEIARVEAAVSAAQPGPIIWSPENDALVYTQYDSFCPLAKVHVVHFDLSNGESQLLFASDTPTFGTIAWEEPGQLTLTDENGAEWQYDFETKELAQRP
jgi:hypothetical protein